MKPASASKLLPNDRTALAKLRLQEKVAAKKKTVTLREKRSKNDHSSDDGSSSEEEQTTTSSNKFGSLGLMVEANNEKNKKKPQPKKKAAPEAQSSSSKKPSEEKASTKKEPTTSKKDSNNKKEEAEPVLSLPSPKSRRVGQEEEKDNNKIETEESSPKNKITLEGESSPKKSPQQQQRENSNEEDLQAILNDDDAQNNENDKDSSKEDPSVIEAYDEFNLVEHKKKNKKDDDDNNNNNKEDDQKWDDHGVLLSEQLKAEKQPPQHFDYFLLIDFECTCDESAGFDNEIIEMPALLYDTKTLTVVAEYHTYVKPLRNPILTPFCHQLTGIKQEQVEEAPCYDEALRDLVIWVQETLFKLTGSRRSDGSKLCVATDGPCDLEVFGYLFMHVRDGFNYPNFFQRYIDVKQVYRDEYGEGKYWKIKDMLNRFGLRFEGNQHSGIDDTRNLGRIVSQMIRRGTVFEEICYVNNLSGRRRVPAYIWNRAKQTVKKATERRKIGLGPKMAERCRQGLLGLSDREVASVNSVTLMGMLKRFSFVRIKVRANEFSNAPSTPLLVVMFCLFVASIVLKMMKKTAENGEATMVLNA